MTNQTLHRDLVNVLVGFPSGTGQLTAQTQKEYAGRPNGRSREGVRFSHTTRGISSVSVRGGPRFPTHMRPC